MLETLRSLELEGVDGKKTSVVMATTEEEVRLLDLPPLHPRPWAYWREPICGVSAILILEFAFVQVMRMIEHAVGDKAKTTLVRAALTSAWVEAGMLLFSVGYLLFGGANVVRRTARSAYPMPAVVATLLKVPGGVEQLSELENIRGPEGSKTLGSYCMRCLLWRKPYQGTMHSHHCSVCQRCVDRFDRHCSFYGRCITAGNLPCFSLVLLSVPAGVLTLLIAVVGGLSEPALHSMG